MAPSLVRADNPISANQFLHPAASLSVEQTSKQSKQNVQYLSQYRGSIVLVLFFAHSSLSAGSCHSAPVTGNPRQSEAMSPQQLATCRQWPGPTVALHPGLSAVHTDLILVSSFSCISSLTSGVCSECLQWPALPWCCIMWVETPGPWSPVQWSLDTAVPVSPPLTIIHTRGADQKH